MFIERERAAQKIWITVCLFNRIQNVGMQCIESHCKIIPTHQKYNHTSYLWTNCRDQILKLEKKNVLKYPTILTTVSPITCCVALFVRKNGDKTRSQRATTSVSLQKTIQNLNSLKNFYLFDLTWGLWPLELTWPWHWEKSNRNCCICCIHGERTLIPSKLLPVSISSIAEHNYNIHCKLNF
jgi:hypothetical protein